MSKAWMPLYIGDYLGDTSHLNQGQHGAYLLFLMHYWQRGALPADADSCYQIAHAMDMHSKSNVDSVLKQYFVLDGDHYRHDRADKELERAKSSFERRSGASKKRWGEKPTSKADSLDMQRISNPSDCDSDSDIESEVIEIAKLHPKIADPLNLPTAYSYVIAEAISRHNGRVLSGTKRFREAYDQWPKDQQTFATGVEKFFKTSEYLLEPQDRRNGNGSKHSASAIRTHNSRQNIIDGIRADISRRTGPDGPELKIATGK